MSESAVSGPEPGGDRRRWLWWSAPAVVVAALVIGGVLVANPGQVQDVGFISGRVVSCPVSPTAVSPAAVSPAYVVTVTKGKNKVATDTIGKSGIYRISVPAGDYKVEITIVHRPSGAPYSSGVTLPAMPVTVKANSTTGGPSLTPSCAPLPSGG
jgi:hypothetical protein